MTGHDLQKTLQSLPPVLNHIIAEPVGEHFPWERRDCDARALALEDIPKVFKVRVAATNDRMLQFESGDVRPADDFVRRVHVS